jgi:hypothetical protein
VTISAQYLMSPVAIELIVQHLRLVVGDLRGTKDATESAPVTPKCVSGVCPRVLMCLAGPPRQGSDRTDPYHSIDIDGFDAADELCIHCQSVSLQLLVQRPLSGLEINPCGNEVSKGIERCDDGEEVREMCWRDDHM